MAGKRVPYVVQLDSPPAIVETDTRRADELKKRVTQLDTSLALNSFELGDIFAEIKRDHLYDEETFVEYVKKSGVDISTRQVEYLIQISEVAKALNINKTALVKAKNSKLKEIFSLDHNLEIKDAETLEYLFSRGLGSTEFYPEKEKMADVMVKLVDEAPSLTLTQVKEDVKILKGKSEEESPDDLMWLNFPIRRDAKEIVDLVVERGRSIVGTTIDIVTKEAKDASTAAIFEKVFADWLADPHNQIEEFTNDTDIEFQDIVEEEN